MLRALIILLLLSHNVLADERWQITPVECVVDAQNETCETVIQITLRDLTLLDQDLCVFIEQQWVGCFAAQRSTLRYPTNIQQSVTLVLKINSGQVVAEFSIPYTVLSAQQKRRRIRLPWSVF